MKNLFKILSKTFFIFPFLSLFLLLPSSVYAATSYVNSDSNGSASNPTRAFNETGYTPNDSYQSLSAAYLAASAGDTIEFSGGESGKTYLGHTASLTKTNLTLQGSSIPGYNGIVTIDYNPSGGTYTIGPNADGIVIKNLTVSRRGGQTSEYAMSIYKNNTSVKNLTIKNTTGGGIRINSAASNTLLENIFFDMSTIGTISGNNSLLVGKAVNMSNSIFSGVKSAVLPGTRAIYFSSNSGSSTINNTIISNASTKPVVLNSGVTANFNNCIFTANLMLSGTTQLFTFESSGGTVNTNSCLIQGASKTPHLYTTGTGTWNSTNDILNGFPYYTSTKENLGFVLLSTDDGANIDYFKTIADNAMNNYSIPMTIFVSNTYKLTATEKQTLQTLYKAGHEIATHTRHHPDLSYTDALNVTYKGNYTNMALVVANSGTSLSISGTGDTHGPINLTSASYDTLGEICKLIGTWTNFTCTKVNTNIKDSVLSISLLDATTPLPKNTAKKIPFDNDPGPNNRYYKEEITNSISDLEAAIHEDPDSSSYRVKTMAFPYNYANAQVITWIKNNTNLIGIRRNGSTGTAVTKNWLGSIDVYNAYEGYSIVNIKGPNYDSLSLGDKESRIRQTARAIMTLASNGFFTGVLSHNSLELTAQEHGWLVDELAKYKDAYNIRVNTFANLINEIRTSGNWTDVNSDGIWERTFTGNDDFRLRPNSPLIDRGITISGRITDMIGTAVPQGSAPDIGPYEFLLP